MAKRLLSKRNSITVLKMHAFEYSPKMGCVHECVTASKLAWVKACRFYPTSFNADSDATKEITTALQLGPKDQIY